MKAKPIYQRLAELAVAIKNCQDSGNTEWLQRHTECLCRIIREYAPSGSGFDNGTMIRIAASGADRLTFETSYHHMNDGGMYDGWTEHVVTVRPNLLSGFDLRVSGRNRNGIKEYIGETFALFLQTETEQ